MLEQIAIICINIWHIGECCFQLFLQGYQLAPIQLRIARRNRLNGEVREPGPLAKRRWKLDAVVRRLGCFRNEGLLGCCQELGPPCIKCPFEANGEPAKTCWRELTVSKACWREPSLPRRAGVTGCKHSADVTGCRTRMQHAKSPQRPRGPSPQTGGGPPPLQAAAGLLRWSPCVQGRCACVHCVQGRRPVCRRDRRRDRPVCKRDRRGDRPMRRRDRRGDRQVSPAHALPFRPWYPSHGVRQGDKARRRQEVTAEQRTVDERTARRAAQEDTRSTSSTRRSTSRTNTLFVPRAGQTPHPSHPADQSARFSISIKNRNSNTSPSDIFR